MPFVCGWDTLPFKMNNLIITSDGSHTLFNPEIGEHYHSTFGAVSESEHIFIRAGLDAIPSKIKHINLLEIGLGTGLNALLAMRWAEKHKREINYFAVEAFPLRKEVLGNLNYAEILEMNPELFSAIHMVGSKKGRLSKYFSFAFQHDKLQDFNLQTETYDLVFFDAFSPDVQPEMWTEDCFMKIAQSMKRGGVLTTYSCKGIVKRVLKSAGFQIEKLPGPPGKREFLRAVKG